MRTNNTDRFSFTIPEIDLENEEELRTYFDRPHFIEYQLAIEVASYFDYEEHGPESAERYAEISGMIEGYADENPDLDTLRRLFEDGTINADRAGEFAEIIVLGGHVFEQYGLRSMKGLVSAFTRDADERAGIMLAVIADALKEAQQAATTKRQRERVAKALSVLAGQDGRILYMDRSDVEDGDEE